jgi:phosphoglycolate phosphatase
MIELVALDMAGTTIDDHGAVYEALLHAALATGASCTEADVEHWMGADKRVALHALAELGGVSLDEDGIEKAYSKFSDLLAERYRAEPPVPIAGVPQALAALKADGVKVALTTGFARDVAYPLLDSIGWAAGNGLIDAVVCVDEVAAGRPAPDLINQAMERTGVSDPTHVVAAGDTVVDLRAAKSAGVLAVGVGTGKLGLEGLRHEPHDYLLDSAADLPALLTTLAES